MGITESDLDAKEQETLEQMLDQGSPGRHSPGLPGYSQASQDLFALWVCGYNCTYLELGAFHPVCLSNTFLLEQGGWSGESIELNSRCEGTWSIFRRNPLFIGDATIGLSERVDRLRPDYVSVDIDAGNLEAIRAVLAASHRPKCLTVETNDYKPELNIAEQVAPLMVAAGYMAAAERVAVCGFAFESFWVHESVPDHQKYRVADGIDHHEIVVAMLHSGFRLDNLR